MIGVQGFILRVKRAETPFYARLKAAAKSILTFHVPVPGVVKPLL
jgi:hypothetical protein